MVFDPTRQPCRDHSADPATSRHADTSQVATVDLIPAPAGDAVTFRLRRSRLWLGSALIGAGIWLLIRGVLIVVGTVGLGFSLDAGDFVEAAVTAVLYGSVFGTGAVVGARKDPGWVRASTAGLEFAATRRVPVFLPWPAVQAVRLRFAGPFTELVITPTSLDAASVASVPALAPRVRRRSGAPAFIVDVGMMTPGPSVLFAELNRRLTAHG